jgi:mannose-6-phosphate isomerase-like protein (cupin superfamily)
MRAITIGLCGILLVLGGVVAFGQREAGKAARRDTPAPTDKSASWTMAEMKAVGQELGSSKETTHRFFGEKAYNMEVRRLAGPQPILQHGKKSDFMVIQEGEGTFMSGGELVNGKAQGADPGDMSGDSIHGGTSRVLKAGDVMYVPAGIPHGFTETKDHVTFIMLRFDTK